MKEEDILLKKLGEKIRAIREQKGFSQQTFAVNCGLGIAYYGRIERGRHNITAINIIKIALTLNVEIGELFPSIDDFKILMKENNLDTLKARDKKKSNLSLLD